LVKEERQAPPAVLEPLAWFVAVTRHQAQIVAVEQLELGKLQAG